MSQIALLDGFGRRIDYLRLSVTDRCNLRCGYCLPKGYKGFKHPSRWLATDEMVRLVRAFVELGVRRVRLTGGEPLMRSDLPALAAALGAVAGLEDLSLSSNCTRMEALAEPLARAGVGRLNVSLDSLKRDVFRQITRGDLDAVLRGIDAAAAAGMRPIRVNAVFMPGVNDTEIESLLGYCATRGFTLRLIESMPIGAVGQVASRAFGSLEPIKERLARQFDLIPDVLPGGGPARYYRVGASETRIGFITPLSRHFCATCNRVRLSVDGVLYPCLGQEHSEPLRALLRAGCDDAELKARLRLVIARKPQGHEFTTSPSAIPRLMAITGG